MTRAILTTGLLTSLLFACSSTDDAPAQARTEAAAPANEAADPRPSATPAEPARSPEAPEMVIDEPVLASTTPTVTPATAPAKPVDLRSPSLLPADTPAEHVAAFTGLRVGKHDKPPIAGVGASGIHLDELAVGKGWAASRCEQLDSRFSVGADDRVNVCFRVVHPRVDETVTVEWARAGKLRQRIVVNVRPTHAYLSRAWLPVSAGRAGEWTATVKSEDGSVLGQVAFVIAD